MNARALPRRYAELWGTAPGGLNVSIQWSASACNLGEGTKCTGPAANQQLLAVVKGT